jgi:hypothetical protein
MKLKLAKRTRDQLKSPPLVVLKEFITDSDNEEDSTHEGGVNAAEIAATNHSIVSRIQAYASSSVSSQSMCKEEAIRLAEEGEFSQGNMMNIVLG